MNFEAHIIYGDGRTRSAEDVLLGLSPAEAGKCLSGPVVEELYRRGEPGLVIALKSLTPVLKGAIYTITYGLAAAFALVMVPVVAILNLLKEMKVLIDLMPTLQFWKPREESPADQLERATTEFYKHLNKAYVSRAEKYAMDVGGTMEEMLGKPAVPPAVEDR